MSKKKVLVVTEYHGLASGFGTYAKHLLEGLHKTGKYELAEFAAYGKTSSGKNVPWKFYGNAPEDDDDEETKQKYNSSGQAQFGQWRFDLVCLDFKPDIVLSYRDPWMDMFITQSPARPFFHWVWMPTVDSAPQKQSWLDGFASTDAILCYSEYGIRTLENDGGGLLNIVGCASPGIDPEVYKIYDKKEIRRQLGIKDDINIVGTVMRNQKRKLFPELIKSFEKFLKTAPATLANNTFLYLHTSYPEKMGWNLSYLIAEHGVGGKVLATYICRSCGNFHTHFFCDAIKHCPKCNKVSAVLPNVTMGLTIENLVKVYNTFDLYVQYAICEGFGMPQVEAAACGVPVAASDYSAMEDVVRWTKGYPIRVQKMFRELETNAERVYPDNDHLVEIMIRHLSKSSEEKLAQGYEVRDATIKRYNWDSCVKAWENYVDNYHPKGMQGQWSSPPRLFQLQESLPQQQLNNDQFVEWIYGAVMNEPVRAYSYEGVKLLRDLNFGAIYDQGVLDPIDRNKIFESYKNRARNKLIFEQVRCGMLNMNRENFIKMAEENAKES